MFCQMSPNIVNSVRVINDSKWLLGSYMVCELVSTLSANSLVSWTGLDGRRFSIRQAIDSELQHSDWINESVHLELIHSAGTSSAVWKLGGVICKVKAWDPALQLESDTIKYLEQHNLGIRTPKILFDWVDETWHRSFLLLHVVEGTTLRDAWTSLSYHQRQNVAATIAEVAQSLASLQSSRLEGANGLAALENFLSVKPPANEPSWKPHPLGPFSKTQLLQYLSSADDNMSAVIGESFHFYHADMGPTNIIVSQDGEVKGILDWESAAFYPKFWIGTKPNVSAGFLLGPDQEDREQWMALLSDALQERGFSYDKDAYFAWTRAIEHI